MFGNLILMILSYLILRYVKYYDDLKYFWPGPQARLEMLLGFCWPLLYFSIFEFSLAFLVENPYQLNPQYTFRNFLNTFGYIFRGVLFEELIFRGVFFYLIWEKWGAKTAIILSSMCFGIYHWFAWQAFGNPMRMVIVFLTTGSMGLIFAYSFVRSKSMYLPIALHFGGNLATMLVFSKDSSIGTQLLFKSFATDPTVPAQVLAIPFLILHFIGYQCFTFWLLYQCYRTRGIFSGQKDVLV